MAARDEKSTRFLLHLKPLQGAVEAFCRRSLYETELLEDVLQEAMMRAFRDFGLFEEGTAFRAWIFRYVHLCVLEANRRSRTRRQEVLKVEPAVEGEGLPEPDDELSQWLLHTPDGVLDQCEQTLRGAIVRLSDLERGVLLLRALGEFRYREIADILGIPMGTVMSALSRARWRVRQHLAETGGTADAWASRSDRPRERPGGA